jgi:DNA polymerase/3'-5' exonuclease PolX
LKKDLDPKFAGKVAADFQKRTGDLYERCELAGSLRRKAPVVHDIDFSVIPKGDDVGKWRDEVKRRVAEIGGKVASFGEVISNFTYKGVQVNLFLCPGPDSWGVTLMWATGPTGHTIGMTIKAKKKGLLINSRGIWTLDEPPSLVPARTEHEVGRILDWKYKPPETRGKDVKERPAFY